MGGTEWARTKTRAKAAAKAMAKGQATTATSSTACTGPPGRPSRNGATEPGFQPAPVRLDPGIHLDP